MDSANEDSFLDVYYSSELKQAASVTPPKKPKEEQDFFELNQQPIGYHEGVPFKIEARNRSYSYINHLSDESSMSKVTVSKHYSNQQFQAEEQASKNSTLQPADPTSKEKYQPPQQQHQESHNNIDPTAVNEEHRPAEVSPRFEDEQNMYADAAQHSHTVAAVASPPKPNRHKEATHEQRHSMDRPLKKPKRPYTKVPFHGLFYKRHIRSPNLSPCSNPQQERPCEQPNKYASVSKLFVKQIVDLQDSVVETLDEASIGKLNEILRERLNKYEEHYKEQLKEKFYIQANQLMKRVIVNRKLIARQKGLIAEIQSTTTRQSTQYSDMLHLTIAALQSKIKIQKAHNKQLATWVHRKDESEKKIERRQQVYEQLNELYGKCRIAHEDKLVKQAKEEEAARRVESITNRLEQATERIRDLQSTIIAVVEKYYEYNPQKTRAATAAQHPRLSAAKSESLKPQPGSAPKHKMSNPVLRRSSPVAERYRYSNSSSKLARKIFWSNTKSQSKVFRIYQKHEGAELAVSSVQLKEDVRFVPFEPMEGKLQGWHQSIPPSEKLRVDTEVQTDNESSPEELLPVSTVQSAQEQPGSQASQGQESEPEKPVVHESIKEHLEGALSKPFTVIRKQRLAELENPEASPTKQEEIAPSNTISPKMLILNRRRFQRLQSEGNEPNFPRNSYLSNSSFTVGDQPAEKKAEQRPRHRIRALHTSQIESIVEEEEPEQLSSMQQTKLLAVREFASPSQPLLQCKRKFELRSGTDTDQVGQLQEIPLRRLQPSQPSWLSQEPSLF